MKKIHLFCLFALLSSAAFGQSGYSYDQFQEAKKAVEAYAKAFGASDVEGVSSCLADTHVHVNPFGSELTREELLDDMRSGTLHFDFYAIESLELIPLEYNLYLAKGVVHACAHRDGQEMSERFRFVHLLMPSYPPMNLMENAYPPMKWRSIYTQHTKILNSSRASEEACIVADI